MVNKLDNTGLQINTLPELLASLTTSLQGVFGTDINLNSNSPDGQFMNIFAQIILDYLELIMTVYNSFDPDSVSGVVLDSRCALNGVTRTSGTFTLITLSLTVSQALSIPGLDSAIDDPTGEGFTVSDGSGNNFVLLTTQTPSGSGTYNYKFRAQNIGAIYPTIGTITNIITVTAGIVSINNPNPVDILGIEEETDTDLRIKRNQSFFLQAVSPAEAVQAALLEVPGVSDAFVPENNTGSEAGGIDPNSIWAIVDGTATDINIATAIFYKKSSGCGMTGGETYDLLRANGYTQTIKWDVPTPEDLYIKFTIVPYISGASHDLVVLKEQIALQLSYKLNQTSKTADIFALMSSLITDGYITACSVSKNGSNWYDAVAPTAYDNKFAVTTAKITITQ